MKIFDLNASIIESQNKASCIVKLKTSSWFDRRGLHSKRSLIFLRRLCKGHNLLEEDCSAIGSDEAIGSIINLNSCEDGIYEVISCNEKRDWETGYIDDYDLKLIPYKKESE